MKALLKKAAFPLVAAVALAALILGSIFVPEWGTLDPDDLPEGNLLDLLARLVLTIVAAAGVVAIVGWFRRTFLKADEKDARLAEEYEEFKRTH